LCIADTLKKYHVGKKIHTTKSGEFVLHQLYSQKKNPNIKRNSIVSAFIQSQSQSQSQKHIISIDIESDRENNELDNENIKTNHIMTDIEEKNLRKALQNHFVFRDITEELLNSVIEEFVFCTFLKGKIIYNEGDEGNFFYIISKGSVEALEKNKFKKNIINGIVLEN
jgi:hypothetical protein